MPLMTKAAYAKSKGWKKPYLSSEQMKDKLEPAMEVDPADKKWKVNSEKADKIFEAEADPARKLAENNPASGEAEGFYKTRSERESVKLTREKLDLAKELGQTLPTERVWGASASTGQKLREALSSRNRRLGELLATISDPAKIKTILDDEDRAMLVRLSNDFMRGISGKAASQSEH